MSSDIAAKTLTATGTVFAGRMRVKSIQYIGAGGGPGAIVLRDGGSGGTIRLDLATAQSGVQSVYIPDDGILFNADCHATLTNITSLTVFYGG